MNVFSSLSEAGSHGGIRSLAMGFFDGVHLGHRRVIENAAQGYPPESFAVLTFKVHPQSVLYPERSPLLLTGLPHKLWIMQELGVRHILTLPFNREIARITATQFLEDLHTALPELQRISVGPNWRFGHKREGDLAFLAAWCHKHDIELAVAEPVLYKREIISSSRIREKVRAGSLNDAGEMLGRRFALFGKVVEGRKTGRELGFPTINLGCKDECYPPAGVYVGWTRWNGAQPRVSAINIGTRPTIGDRAEILVEAHLLDFSGNLYGETVSIFPLIHLRPERKFPTLDGLKNQLADDVREAAILGKKFHADL